MYCGLLLLLIIPFFLHAQDRYAVVIDEIMADPSPNVSLPGNEWIELKNISTLPVNLQNWRIGDANSQSGIMPFFVLQPDSFVIICPTGSVPVMQGYGNVIGVSGFPSLDNEGDQLFLKTNTSMIMHAVAYASSWYRNAVKSDGGWTLEMIDTHFPCIAMDNWKAGVDTRGGSPGKKNSIDAVNTDQSGPSLQRAFIIDSLTLIAVFSEPLDSLSGAIVSNYSLDGGLTIVSAITISPLFDRVLLSLANPLPANTVLTLTVEKVTDCSNNSIGSTNKTKIGLPADALLHDIVINEVLFNPKSGGSDYVELYNRSNKIIDAGKLFIGNRNTSGVINSLRLLAASPFYLFPGEYIVITEEPVILGLDYFVQNPGAVLQVSSLASYPDDEGTVIVLNFQGEVLDELNYKEEWHFALIKNPEGISLERIDPEADCQDPGNWHSAASTAGFGTPGYKNSQYKSIQDIHATIKVTPGIFSPDNDGHDDVATIQYKLSTPGYVGNIRLFDANGRMVRSLVSNGTTGLTGYWNWDGLNDKGQKLPAGIYIILTEFFNLEAKKKHFKNVVVLARKLN